jgi:ATP-dependent helicase/nuclease subunit A
MNELTQHQRAALNYSEHISLTANAGSGKTLVLAKRFVEIAVKEDISLHNLVAITFTEKAAAELYKKISEEIESRIIRSVNPDLRKKLGRLRRQLVSANISTIHSFCIDILKEFPAEAQIDANFTPIDKTLSDELIQISVEEVIKNGLKDPASIRNLKYLIRIFSSKNLFARELLSLIDKRKNILSVAEKIYDKSEEEIASGFYIAFEEFVLPLLQNNKSRILQLIEEINKEVLKQKPDNPLAAEIEKLISESVKSNSLEKSLIIFAHLGEILFTKEGFLRKQSYLTVNRDSFSIQIETIENYFSEINNFSIDEDHRKSELELARFGKILLKYFREALSVYEEKKRQNGYLDFEDILILTKNILTDENIRIALSNKYRYIMVDEYQDTNEIQYEIFMPILDFLKRGNLFVVGDEKQSIYMFRDAELEIFNRTRNEIALATKKDNLLILPHSFRMAPHICLFTNYLFSRLFENPNPFFNEVEYNELICARNGNYDGKVEFILAEKGNREKSESELIAGKIFEIIGNSASDNTYNFNDIAILCRRRKSFEELEKTFTKFNIPHNIVGGKGFYQQQIIYDIFNYLSFLLNKNDDAALTGLLRSPFFSVSDPEIFEISLNQGNTLWEKLNKYSVNSERISGIKLVLQENLELAYSVDITVLLRKIFSESGFLSVVSASPENVQEIANLEKLIALSQNFRDQGFRTLFDFVNFLYDSIETMVDEGDAVTSSTENSVKIMTLHQAKGLEFSVVFLYNCHDKGRADIVKSKTLQVDKKFGILTKLPPEGNLFQSYQQAPVVSLYNYIMKRKNLSELKRLLYVGVTRAKDILFISGEHNNYNFPENSFLGLINSVVRFKAGQNELKIEDNLNFLISAEKGFIEEKKNVLYIIPIIRRIENLIPLSKLKEINKQGIEKFLAGEIKESEKEEIVSATKISVYKQCPLKYKLTYEFGYSDLFKNYKRSLAEFDFRNNENEYNLYSDIKGRVIHKILEKNYNLLEVKELADRLIQVEMKEVLNSEEENAGIRNSIINTVDNYYHSDTFKELSAFNDYKNELEIYAEEEDYFLYGIIDKVIIDGNEAIIIDYKTDEIEKEEIDDRFLQYLIQLKFYAYLITKLYPRISKFLLRIIFLKHPGYQTSVSYTKKEIKIFSKEIKQTIRHIRNKDFKKNLDHCRKCSYSSGNSICIKDDN